MFAFDGNAHGIIAHGRPERWQMDVFMEFLAARGLLTGTALYIGANIGAHTILFAQHFAKVIAFEPNPRTFALLALNAGQYAPNALPLRIAPYSEERDMTLVDGHPQNFGASSLKGDPATGISYPLRTRRLDDLPEIAGERIGLVKLDTEGTEADVLQGARATLNRDRPAVILEDFGSRNGVKSEAIAMLESCGYQSPLLAMKAADEDAGDALGWQVGREHWQIEAQGADRRYVIRACLQ